MDIIMKNRPISLAHRVEINPPARTRAAQSTATDAEYSVGYGKPPPESRWKRGQSGNPAGRPKGSRNVASMAKTLLDEFTRMRSGDTSKRVSRIEGLLWKQYERAAKGDLRAIDRMITLYTQATTSTPKPEQHAAEASASEPLTPGDEAALEAYRNMVIADHKASTGGGAGVDPDGDEVEE